MQRMKLIVATDNAYVSGMSEELGFHKNELVQFQTMYSVGAVVGQIPFALLFPKVRMNWLIPGLDIGWGIFTVAHAFVRGRSALLAVRLMIGVFEAGFYPTAVAYLSSFYCRYDLAVRVALFYGQVAIAGAFSGSIGNAITL